ncbi:MAG TPA: NCS2 family permease [Actinomycetota bacterium]|nr:NCS2 family permease [Actinomycetota bacterium]
MEEPSNEVTATESEEHAPRSGLDRFFGISAAGSSVRTEVVAGLTTWMTMAYILFVNPSVLGAVPDRNGLTLAFPLVLTSTALAAAVSSLAMGMIARYPFGVAAGLGLNAVVAFQLVAGNGLSWPEAMGVIVTEGIIIFILVLTGFREAVMNAIPLALKQAIGLGIGLFIAFIGFINAGFVGRPETPALLVELGRGGELRGLPVAVFIIGLLSTSYLVSRRFRGALLLGILGTTAIAILLNELVAGGNGWPDETPAAARFPERLIALPTAENFSLIGDFSFAYFGRMGAIAAVLAVFTIMISDFFDTMGTVVGLGARAGYLDDRGRLPRVKQVLGVDSAAAAIGGAFSASSNTTYIESASGISEGGRTGLTASVVGLLFLVSILLWPLADVIPPQATAPALIIVGFLMMELVRDIPWERHDIGIPAFLTMVVMPFTFSITNGIGAGFVSYTIIKLLRGEAREVHWMMYLSTVAFLIYFGIYYVRAALGVG